MPDIRCRILTGRITSTAFSSSNVSYINVIAWAITSGSLQVDLIVVTTDTTFESITGVMDYTFGNFKLLPRNNDDFVQRRGTVATVERPAIVSSARLYLNPVKDIASVDLTPIHSGNFSIDFYDIRGSLVR